MINLLPPNVRENFIFARRNTTLIKWVIGVFVGVLGISAVSAGGWLFINRAQSAYSQQINNTNQQLNTEKLNQVQSQIDGISSNLKLVVQVLSKEVLFSKLLTQIGGSLPSGAILTGLNIIQVGGGLDLQAAAVDYQTASQIQVNLQDPANKIFSKADIVSIVCQSANGSGGTAFSANYPCKADIRAEFATNNPFLFINSGAKS